MRSPYTPHTTPPGDRPARNSFATGAADFLRVHDNMAAILPTLTRLIALKKDCMANLPAMFDVCDVLQFDAGQLILATPNGALATKLKQQLPKLQEQLIKLGWQVSAIRLKVQVTKIPEKSTYSKQLTLPSRAVSAFAELGAALEESPRNAALKAALDAMVRRPR